MSRYRGTCIIAAAYGISKNATKSILESSLVYRSDFNITPEPIAGHEKESIWGEDAFFIANIDEFRSRAAGIADGVGGWVHYGVDPSLISRKLMQFAQSYVLKQQEQGGIKDNNSKSTNYALRVLQYAYENVTNTELSKIRAGSTTACIIYVTNSGKLHSANLGDSGYMVVRDDEVIYRSKELQHRFNAPYQIGVCPSEREGDCILNTPKDAELNKLQLKNGDMIILGTDGLFDNLFDQQIVELVKTTRDQWMQKKEKELEALPLIARQHRQNFEIAKNLCLYAKVLTHTKHKLNKTPFALAYEKAYNKEYMYGAKVDDISCIVCTIYSE